jgi:hypothetical protein
VTGSGKEVAAELVERDSEEVVAVVKRLFDPVAVVDVDVDGQSVGRMISIDHCACFAINPIRLSWRRD